MDHLFCIWLVEFHIVGQGLQIGLVSSVVHTGQTALLEGYNIPVIAFQRLQNGVFFRCCLSVEIEGISSSVA